MLPKYAPIRLPPPVRSSSPSLKAVSQSVASAVPLPWNSSSPGNPHPRPHRFLLAPPYQPLAPSCPCRKFWRRIRYVFLAYLTCVIIFNSAATTQKQNTAIAMLSLTLFFESVCFPTIVALGIRGIGRHTKRGSGLIVAGVSGGAAVPPILGVTVR